MAQIVNKLSALGVQRKKTDGLFNDGAGLYLQVTNHGNAKSWVFRFSLRGRSREMGIGSCAKVTLVEARTMVRDYHKLIAAGLDPIDARERERAKVVLEQTGSLTFSEAAKLHIASHCQGLRSVKYATQYGTTIAVYAERVLGRLLVRDIATAHVMRVLEPIWHAKPDTAQRVRARIEKILDWAKAHGYRDGENPARWRGHLALLLPQKPKVGNRHHAALAYGELPAFMRELRKQDGPAARALEFLILTCTRSGELLKGKSGEIDYGEKLWIVPAAHTKTGQEHRVPLCPRALSLVDRHGTGPLFPINKMSMDDLLRRMGYHGKATPHGFRSTFRDWCGDHTAFPREVAEAALSHKVGNAVELAYRRSDAFDKRRKLMTAWGDYCESAPMAASKKVVPLRSA